MARLLWLSLLAVLLTLSAGCDLLRPRPKELTVEEVMARAADKVLEVTSVHFTLEVSNGSFPLAIVNVTSAQGDVVKPDRLQVKAKGTLAGAAVVEFELRSIGAQQYVTNPLTRRWQAYSLPIVPLLDPERGVPNLMRKLASPTLVGREMLDGMETYHLRGTITPDQIAPMLGAPPAQAPIPADVWIDSQEFLVRQVVLTGAISTLEPEGVVHTLRLSAYNQPVTIEAPPLS